MKLRDLRPCDSCGRQIAGRMPDGTTSIQFFVVRTTSAILNVQAINEHMGLAQFFGGHHGLAEVFAPNPEVASLIGDQKGCSWTETFLCLECYCKPLGVAWLPERSNDREAEREKEAEATS